MNFRLLLILIMVTMQTQAKPDWKTILNEQLPLLGHRNWILIVDKAFPAQTAPGIEVVYTDESLPEVLEYTFQQVAASSHVKPIVYTDSELQFITEDMAEGVDEFKKSLQQIIKGQDVKTLLHESVFSKLDEASKLFKVLVLKTTGTIAYSSVFIELDCAYWNGNKEKQLRENMQKVPSEN